MLKTFYYLQNVLGKAGLWPGDVEIVFKFKGPTDAEKFKMQLTHEMSWVQANTAFTDPTKDMTRGVFYGVPFVIETGHARDLPRCP